MRSLKLFSTLIFVGVIVAALMPATPAHAQHIFPWPTAECPLRWHRYRGRYYIGMDAASPYRGHVFLIDIHRSPQNANLDYMQITQFDSQDHIYAQGQAYLPVDSRSLRETMRVPSTNQTYMVELNAYTRERTKGCNDNDLVMGISFYPINGGRVAVAPQYILIPVE